MSAEFNPVTNVISMTLETAGILHITATLQQEQAKVVDVVATPEALDQLNQSVCNAVDRAEMVLNIARSAYSWPDNRRERFNAASRWADTHLVARRLLRIIGPLQEISRDSEADTFLAKT